MRNCNELLPIKQKNKRNVVILSTEHTTVAIIEEIIKQYNPTCKLKCIIEYNKGMMGVDRRDQMLACFPLVRKCMKGYRIVFFYLFDMTIFNSFILHNEINTEKKGYLEYKVKIAELLLEIH